METGCSRSLPCPQMVERAPCQTANNLMDQGEKDPLLEVWVFLFVCFKKKKKTHTAAGCCFFPKNSNPETPSPSSSVCTG